MYRTKSFWRDFNKQSNTILRLVKNNSDSEALMFIDHILNKHGYDLAFDLTLEDGKGILIFSPEGDCTIAKQIDVLVNDFPNVPDWVVYGRRRKKPISDVMAIISHIFRIQVDDAKFIVKIINNKLSIHMYSDVASALHKEDQQYLINTFLDHSLGEDIVMIHVGKKDISPYYGNEDIAAFSSEQMVERVLGLIAS